MANFEVFLKTINLTTNPKFLKSGDLVLTKHENYWAAHFKYCSRLLTLCEK